ncbi:MAG: DUF1501 domain-containing protein [Bacteroidota bacterium]
MKRRNFLRTAATTATALPIAMSGMGVGVATHPLLASAIDEESDRVLVLIQLNGGNDGLSMLPPLSQYDNLGRVRRNILIPKNDVLKVDNTVGFHPSMYRVKGELYDEGKLQVVQSVGYPNAVRSHFRGTDIKMSASPANEIWSSGWVGRYYDQIHSDYPYGYPNSDFPDPFALTMGSLISMTCQGAAVNYSLAIEDPFRLFPLAQGAGAVAPNTPYGQELEFLQTSIAQTNAYSEVILAAANKGANTVDYLEDDNRLGKQLKNVALLMSGGLRTKVYVVHLGGFDTHAGQSISGSPLKGQHAELLTELSEGVAIFMEDMRNQGMEDRVLMMTFSEFGRQIKENASYGTDHGTSTPMLLFGPCVKGGIIGDNPEIPSQVRSQEAIPMQYDFRNVYGSILMDWMGASEENVRDILFDDFQYMSLIECSATPTSTREVVSDASFELEYGPNPFNSHVQIKFTSANEHIRLSIYDAMGRELKVMIDKRLAAGKHQLTFNGSDLPAGTYYVRIQGAAHRQITRAMMKY